MKVEDTSAAGIGVGGGCGWGMGARPCDTCGVGAARIYYRADGAFLCAKCDKRGHGAGSRHTRVWLCEVCEHAPTVVICHADAAALCAACDADIHSANPLASRHKPLPVTPKLMAVTLPSHAEKP